ncbi:MAG: hypothetical protein U1F27_17730 [Turneriella sp.]
MKVLITAFRPFGRRKNNTSEDILVWLRKNCHVQQNLRLDFAVLPVNFRSTWPELRGAILRFTPDALLILGEKNARRPCLETRALNIRRYKNGTMPIEKSPRKQLHTSLDAARLINALKKGHSNWTISHNAGSYLCNFSYWKVLSQMPDLPCIFFHVPALSVENAQMEIKSIATQIETLTGAIQMQMLQLRKKQFRQKQLTVPGQKAGSAKRKKGA